MWSTSINRGWPNRYTENVAGHWGSFVRDAGTALSVWRSFPLLPLITLTLTLVSFGATRSFGATGSFILAAFALGMALFQVGWVGTERIWYLRGYRGLSLTPREALRFTGAFLWRYFGLGLLVMIPYIVVLIAVSIAVALWVDDPGVRRTIAFGVPLLFVDVWLTFVTPALAFTTSRVSQAVGIGWRMLKAGWPGTAWYALLPPMAVLAITYTRSPEDTEFSLVWVLASGGAALLNLLAKGATAAFYLRQSETGNDGAAFSDQPAAEDTEVERAQQIL